MLSLKKNKIHAAIFYGLNNIRNEEVCYNYDEKGGDGRGVSLKVNACAVCGYDVKVFRHGHRKVNPSVILGHEICGEIDQDITFRSISSKKGKERLKAGSRVVISPVIPCLKCNYCNNKQYNLCTNLTEIGSSIDGSFAENVRIPKI